MSNETIRKKLIEEGRGILEYFEKEVGEIEFGGSARWGYYIYPKGAKHFSDNVLTIIPAYDMNGLLLFMQGGCQSKRVRRCFDD